MSGQLVCMGDSHTVRFGNFLQTQQSYTPVVFAAKGGIEVHQCRHLLKEAVIRSDLCQQRVFLSIGSNNILHRTYNPTVTHRQFTSLIRLIKLRLQPTHIFICKIPVFPRLQKHSVMINQVHQFNTFISNFNSPPVFTLNVPCITDSIHSQYFLSKFRNGRTDLIHLNPSGQQLLLRTLQRREQGLQAN